MSASICPRISNIFNEEVTKPMPKTHYRLHLQITNVSTTRQCHRDFERCHMPTRLGSYSHSSSQSRADAIIDWYSDLLSDLERRDHGVFDGFVQFTGGR